MVNIVILGPGAIGSLWALKMRSAGHLVSVWSTSNQANLELQLDQDSAQLFTNNHISSIKQADLILVTVKAWQVTAALTPLLAHIHPDAMIVLLHNGMGTASLVEQMLPNNPLLLATTTHGAYKPSRQQVQHTGLGTTQLGGYNTSGKQCQFLQAVLHHALPEVTWNQTIEHALWIKLAINCAINPLTAIYQVRNGELANAKHQPEVNQVIAEVYQVLQAEGVPITHQALGETVAHVINATATNHSSMQQDIFHCRPSEIDFITGYLLKRATHHGLQAPHNAELYQAIKQIEQSWNQS